MPQAGEDLNFGANRHHIRRSRALPPARPLAFPPPETAQWVQLRVGKRLGAATATTSAVAAQPSATPKEPVTGPTEEEIMAQCPMVDVLLDKKPASALHDDGATVSLVRRGLLPDLGLPLASLRMLGWFKKNEFARKVIFWIHYGLK